MARGDLLLAAALVKVATVGHGGKQPPQAARRGRQEHAGIGFQIGFADQHAAGGAAVGGQRQQDGFFRPQRAQAALLILALVGVAQAVGIGGEQPGVAREIELGHFTGHGSFARQMRFDTVGATLVEDPESHGITAFEGKPQLVVMLREACLPVEGGLDDPFHRFAPRIGHLRTASQHRTVGEVQPDGRRQQHGRTVAGHGIGQRVGRTDPDAERPVGRGDFEISPGAGRAGGREGQCKRNGEAAEKVHR